MIQKIDDIKHSTHPYSGEIKIIIDLIDKITKIILVGLDVLGFIIAIVASKGLTEWADGHSGDVVDVPTYFFGYIIELESDTFGGSPLMVFLYIIIIFAFISLVILCAKLIITTVLKSKINMLDSAYRTEKLTELLVENQASSHEANSAQ